VKSIQSSTGASQPRFRQHLQDELSRRCARNPQYSLRAFALDLGTDHASLSQLLRGKRVMTAPMIERFGRCLGLAPEAIEAFARRERLTEPGPGHAAVVHEIQTLSQYAAAIVSEWEHLALLELTHVADFRPDVGWIARVLGITPDAVTLALQRLLHLGLLVMEDPHTWRDISGATVFVSGEPDPTAFGRVTLSALAARIRALDPPLRSAALPHELSATTIAVDTRCVPEAVEVLRAARDEVTARLARGATRDAVYRLELRLYPLTNTTPETTP
jgi:plasmid maintenance system antidote protein VapI